ncbi:MAG: Panacea domain-containing protein [Cyanobacteria bacterium J06621_8]
MPNSSTINRVKTTEAIAYILQLHQAPMILSRLLKILYFIDRLNLALNNSSLTNDNYYCQKSGLIPQQTPDLMLQLQLSEILQVDELQLGYISLRQLPTSTTLSPSEIEIITDVYQQKKDLNPLNIREWKYDLWFISNHLRHKGGNLLTPVDMMLGLGKTKAEIMAYLNSQTTKASKFPSSAADQIALTPNKV